MHVGENFNGLAIPLGGQYSLAHDVMHGLVEGEEGHKEHVSHTLQSGRDWDYNIDRRRAGNSEGRQLSHWSVASQKCALVQDTCIHDRHFNLVSSYSSIGLFCRFSMCSFSPS